MTGRASGRMAAPSRGVGSDGYTLSPAHSPHQKRPLGQQSARPLERGRPPHPEQGHPMSRGPNVPGTLELLWAHVELYALAVGLWAYLGVRDAARWCVGGDP